MPWELMDNQGSTYRLENLFKINEKLISKQLYVAVLERVPGEYKNTTLLMPMTCDICPSKTKLLSD